jgi:hypothetical protein
MNIIILSIGRSGSTILAKMARAMGWNLSGADEEYAENVQFRNINNQMIKGQCSTKHFHDGFIVGLNHHKQWVLKDPRLTSTWQQWKPHLDRDGNLLLWLTRDLKAIEVSLRRKNWGKPSPRGYTFRGRTLPEHEAECRKCFEAWSGPKVTFSFERMKEAVKLFDTTRG